VDYRITMVAKKKRIQSSDRSYRESDDEQEHSEEEDEEIFNLSGENFQATNIRKNNLK